MKYFVTGCLLFLSSFNGFSQKSKTMKDFSKTQELSIDVVEFFMKGNYQGAFEKLIKYWPLPKDEMVELQSQTEKFMLLLDERFGEKEAYSKVRNEVIGDFFIRETYIIRYEKSAIRLIFTYYRNDTGWMVNAFKWDDKFAKEFK